MNEKTWQKVEEAAKESIKHPGANKKPLPKDKVKKGQHFILIFRHGESTDNVKKLFSGWRDPDLTEKGRQQALALAPKLKALAAKGLDLELVITSDQRRSKETAKLALAHYPEIVNWEEDWRIKERNYGDLAGKSKEEAMRLNPDQAIKWRRGYDTSPPNGESLQMVEKRVIPFLKELIKRVQNEHIDVALSMHGNSMRVARKFFEKMDLAEELTHENPLGNDYALYVIRA